MCVGLALNDRAPGSAVVVRAGAVVHRHVYSDVALVAAWMVGYVVVSLQDQREIKREIDDLNELERENSQ